MNWIKIKLNEIAEEKRNGYEPSAGEHLNYIGLEHIEQQSLRLNGIGKSSDTISSKKRFNKDDILFGSLRPYFRKVYKPKFSGVCSTDITVIYRKKNFSQDYLFYLIANQPFIDYATNYSNGTRMPRANWKVISKSEWVVPKEKEDQEKIASILSAYDDLIENNTRRIKILEEMAQTIYKEWFVNFRFPGYEKAKFVDSSFGKIPKGWRIDRFENCIKIFNGFAFKSKDYVEDGIKLIRTQDYSELKYVNDKIEVYLPDESLELYRKFLLKEYDFLVIMVGASLGKYGLILPKDLPALQNQNQWALRPIDNNFFRFFLILMMPEFIKRVKSFATGAAREFFRKEHFYEQEILIPSKSILIKFNEIIKPFFFEISHFLHKNRNLRKTRDLLLPKLMSGEVEV